MRLGDFTIATNLVAEWARQSGCQKSKRGAVLVGRGGRMFVGYNRPAIGSCDGSVACRRDCSKICIHAEQTALLEAGHDAWLGEMFHIKVVDGAPVPSGEPSCVECSKLMLRAHISGMWLLQADGWRRWPMPDFHEATLENLGLHRSKP
jgi:deoxycytidylate deaminase